MNNNKSLDAEYWSERYESNTAQWDLGQVSPPIKHYIDQLTNKNCRILIPGCGNSYEAAYLLEKGFTNITLIDIAPALVDNLKRKFEGNPSIEILLGDFFELKQLFDLIIEQTFFCALSPSLRPNYVNQMKTLLVPNGKLVGLLFDRDFDGGPPFGGSKNEYINLFESDFDFKTFDSCYNSFVKRQESELFMIFVRK
ncbi:MAG: methyltransferase domain-containing protein [Sphingobacteriia bacterium]|jgi:SAM-dependent methyltransferase